MEIIRNVCTLIRYFICEASGTSPWANPTLSIGRALDDVKRIVGREFWPGSFLSFDYQTGTFDFTRSS